MPEFDFSQLLALAERLYAQYGPQLRDLGWRVTAALLILLAGMWLARRIGRWIKRAADRQPKIDATIAAVIASSARYVVLFLALMLVLQQFGVQTASIIAVLGAATLAIGLALQGTLSNVAAGVVLLVLRPYKLGDLVEIADKTGFVRDITLFTTELATFDNIKVVVPNGKVIGDRISNISHHAQRRVDLQFRIAYEDDFEAAVALLQLIAREDVRVLNEPAPVIEITELGEQALVVSVWLWCKSEDWLGVRLRMIREGLKRLQAAGFRQPYPVQRAATLEGEGGVLAVGGPSEPMV